MGYRSDVGYRIAATNPQALLEKFLEAYPQHRGKLHDLDITPDYLEYNVLQIKWYDIYPEVQAHQALWEFAREQETTSGLWCRIGEELDDTEQYGFGESWDLPGPFISRVIDMD